MMESGDDEVVDGGELLSWRRSSLENEASAHVILTELHSMEFPQFASPSQLTRAKHSGTG